MRTLIVIPARFGSTRLPAKALADIGGAPMVARVWRRCRLVRNASRVLVATDDERIMDAVRAAGGEAVMTPGDLPSGTDRVAVASRDVPCDLVVNVQGDEPFIAPEAVESLIEAFLPGEGVEVATLATPLRDPGAFLDPATVKVLVNREGDAIYFSRFPIPYRAEFWDAGGGKWHPRTEAVTAEALAGCLKHLGIYAYRPEFLRRFVTLSPTPAERAERLEQLRILEHGGRIRVVVTGHDSHSVDTAEDLARARQLAVTATS